MKLAWLALAAMGCFAADLDAVRAEPNLEKRSEKALQNADAAVDAARKAHEAGNDDAFKSSLQEVHDSILLAKESLDKSGKNARRNPKYFKKAEQNLRRLGRRLDTLRLELSVDDRAPVEALMHEADTMRDKIVEAIMGRK